MTAEAWAKARKVQLERFKRTAEEERTLRGWLATMRRKKGLPKDSRMLMLVGGNKTVLKILGDGGFEEVADKEGDGTSFEVKWTLSQCDINFDALLPGQLAHHFPNSASDLGAKVALHRNLRALRCFDKLPSLLPPSLLLPPTFSLPPPLGCRML